LGITNLRTMQLRIMIREILEKAESKKESDRLSDFKI